MKHFIDIEHIRLEDDEFKQNNVFGFEVGDHISIQTKIDGSNASVYYSDEIGGLQACSRRQELTYDNNLNGFWNYVQMLGADNRVLKWFKSYPMFIMFGEWATGINKIKTYDKSYLKKWVVYDIYNTDTKMYLSQDFVKNVCEDLGLEYIEVLYDGEFKSWDHIKSFLNSSTKYGGDIQEGVVIKNETKLVNVETRCPAYVKIVNDSFKESMKTKVKKEKSADEIEEIKRVEALVNSVVTQRRVEKGIEKLRDQGILPEKLTPQDMKIIARNLPKTIYDDVMKEECEKVVSGGELFGKFCNAQVMKLARNIIIGE